MRFEYTALGLADFMKASKTDPKTSLGSLCKTKEGRDSTIPVPKKTRKNVPAASICILVIQNEQRAYASLMRSFF